MPGFYFWLPVSSALLVCSLVAYFMGFSLVIALVFTLLLWLPLSVTLGLRLTSTFNPKIEEYCDYSDLKRHF
ncbi:MAG: hypothetical protein PVS2B2_18520 [Candidatus Acidiferrum sp.]